MKRAFLLFLLSLPCRAHLPTSSSLTLDDTRGTWTVPLSVLDDAWLIDADSDGKLSAAEWRTLEECVRRELKRGLLVAGTDKPVAVDVTAITSDTAGPAPQLIVRFTVPEDATAIQCRVLATDDPLHRVVRK